MKLIKPSYEIVEQEPGLNGIYKQIERAARVSYKSEDKITEDSAKPFVERLIKSGHTSPLEFGTVYLKKQMWRLSSYIDSFEKYALNPYSELVYNVEEDGRCTMFATTNLRVIIENDWHWDMLYLCEPTEYHEKRRTIKIVTERGITHEIIRHRKFSFMQESTRYANYSKNKFNNEITCILPTFDEKLTEGSYSYDIYNDMFFFNGERLMHPEWNIKTDKYLRSLCDDESTYMYMIENGFTPQIARKVLPTNVKTELYMCGFESDWQHFFDLRTSTLAKTGQPHPDMARIADPLYEEFKKRGYLKDGRKD